MPGAPDTAIDLVSKLLTWNPKDRLTAMEILKHPFLDIVYDPNDKDIIETEPVDLLDFEFECYSLNKNILKDLILDEIILFNSKLARLANKKIREQHPNGLLELIYEK